MEKSNERQGHESKCLQNKVFLYWCSGGIFSLYQIFVLCMWKRVGRNSIKCTKCAKSVHKRCFGPQDSIKMAVSFVCKRCRHLYMQIVTPLDGHDLEVVDRFSYLGDVLSSAGGVQETVSERIRTGWKKFKISGLLYKRGLSLKIKGTKRMKSTEMRMLHMIFGKTVRNKVRNEEIRERKDVESIKEHLRDQCLRWFDYMERMDRESPQPVEMNFKIDCSKNGRPKKSWKEVIDVDMKVRGLKRSEAVDRIL